jgi:hypothetical protein
MYGILYYDAKRYFGHYSVYVQTVNVTSEWKTIDCAQYVASQRFTLLQPLFWVSGMNSLYFIVKKYEYVVTVIIVEFTQ